MTINLTKTKEMVVKGKVEGPLPLSLLISNRKSFLSFSVFIFIVIQQIGTSKLTPFLTKQGGVCTYYECARNTAIV